MIKISTNKTIQTDLIILPLFEKDQSPIALPQAVLLDFKNTLGATHMVYSNQGQKRILLVGLGHKQKFGPQAWRQAIHSIMSYIRTLDVAQASLVLPKVSKLSPVKFMELTAFGVIFSHYHFDEYKQEKTPRKLQSLELITKISGKKINQAIEHGIIIGLAANEARSLANHPGNLVTPSHLAKYAQELARKYKFACKILGPAEIKKEKMGLLAGVAKGSDEPARFIVLEYLPAGRQAENKKLEPIVLIGKGLTFDSGGISIKPADRMEEMKYDMCGAADVLAIFEAVSQLKLPIHLIGLIPSTENLISGQATKPGDILISKSGVSVEIVNTDAEGRLVLADAIDYARAHFQPKLIIDYATLTGAVLVALGDQLAGFFANTKSYDAGFKKAAATSAENFWPLPMPEEYKEHIKSQVADIRNVGEKGLAGATAGAMFLEHFIGTTPWIHLDIAGTAWTMRPKPSLAVGATAWGVYLTVDFLRNL